MKYSSLMLLLLLIGTSCSHRYYVPTAKMVPLFKEKKEARVVLAGGLVNETLTFDVKTAYSITNHLAVSASYMNISHGSDTSTSRTRGNYYDASLGYFTAIGDIGVFEVFGGYGIGKQEHSYPPATGFRIGNAELSYSSIFIQPSFGISVNGFDFAYTSTFSRLHFNSVNRAFVTGTNDEKDLQNIIYNNTSFLFEPSITFRGGWKYIKGQIQFVKSFNLTNSQLPYEKGKVSVGIQFAFAERFLKARK